MCFFYLLFFYLFFFFKQKTAYEIYQCDWSSDVCSSDLNADDMAARGQTTFKSASEWDDAVRDYGSGIVPDGAWATNLDINRTPFIPIIRAMDGRWNPLKTSQAHPS